MTSIAIDRNDGLSSSTAIKGPCRVVATSTITLAGLQTIDGVSLAAGDRVLYAVAGVNAGIWIVDTGSWRRAKDFAGSRDVRLGTQIYVTSGTTYSASGWYVNTANPIVVGTTAITISQNVLLNAAQLIALEAAADASADAALADRLLAEAARDAALSGVPMVFPATRAALAALNTTLYKHAWLAEAGHEGMHISLAGTFTDQIAADTNKLWYVPSTDGSGRTWLRLGTRFERFGYNAESQPYEPGTYETYPGGWGGFNYGDYNVTRGDFLVLPHLGGEGSDFSSNTLFGGLLPPFLVRNTRRSPPDLAQQQRLLAGGVPRSFMRGGLMLMEKDDTTEIAWWQFATTSAGNDGGTIIDWKDWPSAPGAIGRIYSGVLKKYPIQYVAAASTANVDIATVAGGDTVGGRVVATGRMFLARIQSASAENGPYIMGATPGTTVRAPAYDTWTELVGSLYQVASTVGGTNEGSVYRVNNVSGGTLGTTSIGVDLVTGTSGYATTAPDNDSILSLWGFYHPWTGGNGRPAQYDHRASDFMLRGEHLFSVSRGDNMGDITNIARLSMPDMLGVYPWATKNTTLILAVPNAAATTVQEKRVGFQTQMPANYCFGTGATTIGTGATAYIGVGETAATNIYQFRVISAGYLIELSASGPGGQGAGESITFTVMKNGSATSLVLTLNDASNGGAAVVVSVAKGDLIGIKAVASAAATARTYQIIVGSVVDTLRQVLVITDQT